MLEGRLAIGLGIRAADRRRGDGRRAAILAVSLLAHALALAWLALPARPLLEQMLADDLRSVQVDLIRPEIQEQPRPRPAAAPQTTAAPSPAPPFQARQPLRPVPPGVRPLEVPAAGIARPGTAIRPAPLPGEGAGDLRAALRASSAGCVSADAVGLNRREREKCDERFGAAKAKGQPLDGMDAAKRRAIEAQGEAQRMYNDYVNGPMAPGVDHRSKDQPGTMKEIPFVLGAEQDGLGRERKDVVDQIRRKQDVEDRARKYLELRKKAGQ